MKSKRGATELSGVLLVDKPQGMTSHDVVNHIRRATGERRVGHAGTLDPMATGLLVVLIGPATRLASYLTAAQKTYIARVVFGTETSTDDAEGEVTVRAAVPESVLSQAFAAETTEALVGTHEQVPPAYSAVKKDGRVAYKLARAGENLDIAPRTVEVRHARLLEVCREPVAWDMELGVSKGTYIRALARDLGRSLASAAHLGALRRTASGTFDVDDACALKEIDTFEDLEAHFANPAQGLGLPVVGVDAEAVARIEAGARLSADLIGTAQGDLFVLVNRDRLLALYARQGDMLKAQVVLPGGVGGVR